MRELVTLAKTYSNQHVYGWLISEKLDGVRCLWDGGVSRGSLKSTVPFANRASNCICTGLWSRYGNVIHAPNWFLDRLPQYITLDGELWTGSLQEVRSTVSKHVPIDSEWENVRFRVFDSVPAMALFTPGTINNPNWKNHTISLDWNWIAKFKHKTNAPYHVRRSWIVDQDVISQTTIRSTEDIDKFHNDIISRGGEGVMLRNPKALYEVKRSSNLLRIKAHNIDDARVISYIPGTGKHDGRLGALLVEWEDKTFKIGTGFTDYEREFPPPIDSIVRFKHSGLTDDGVPRNASYLP